VTEHGFLLPHVDDLGAPFWAGAAAGELRIGACPACGRLRFPPRPMCPWCRHVGSTWTATSGRGTVWSFVVPHPPVLPEFAAVVPFTIVVVALDDDPSVRLIGNLVADVGSPVDSVDPATVAIGLPVRAVFPEVESGRHLVRWVALPNFYSHI
jgi:uncharacterized OB-fold protein